MHLLRFRECVCIMGVGNTLFAAWPQPTRVRRYWAPGADDNPLPPPRAGCPPARQVLPRLGEVSRQMSVWLWDARDPGDFGGVSGDEDQARLAAEKHLRSGEASSARVELARIRLGGGWLTSSYQRVGVGWNATREADGVAWSPFAPVLGQASSP
jgi:hypothetical protein